MQTNESFWFVDFSQLYKDKKYLKLIPTHNMSANELLNTLTRLMLFLLLIIFIFADIKFTLMPLIIILLIIFYYFLNNVGDVKEIQSDQFKENLENNTINNDLNIQPDLESLSRLSTLSSLKNHYESIEPTEYITPLPCNVDDSEIEPDGDDNIFKIDPDMFLSYEDKFEKVNMDRQFFLPNDELISDQVTFAKWCYGTEPTCKEGFGCYKQNDRLL